VTTAQRWRGPSAARNTAWLAAALWTAYLVSAVAALLLARVNGTSPIEGMVLLVGLGLPSVGAVLAARRPSNPVGWLLLALALSFPMQLLAREYATYSILVRPGSLPFEKAAAWLAGWPWTVQFGLVAFILLLFPDGRIPTGRWRRVAMSVVVSQAVLTTATALSPHNVALFPNPLGVRGADHALDALSEVGLGLLTALILLAAMSLIPRYRHSSAEQRLQIRWVAYAIILLGGLAVLDLVLIDTLTLFETYLFELLFNAVLAVVLPVTVGIAILKHRLYDIDRLINRTMVYASVTVLLGLVYTAGVFVGGRLLDPVLQESALAVAVSTLAVAALFQPARRRVQNVVDRRFYRRRFDRTATVDAFSIRLRDQVDLDAISTELLHVIGRTVQPAQASIWLRTHSHSLSHYTPLGIDRL